MPDRLVRHAFGWIDRHAELAIFVMFVVMLLAAIFAAIGWNKARGAERRITVIEAQRAAELAGKNIADVATCFNTARNRPRLIVVLRGLAADSSSGDTRRALQEIITEYGMGTPTLDKCEKLAIERGVDPEPYLKNPAPGTRGNQEGR